MVDRKWGWTTLESGCTSYRKPAYMQKFFIDLKYFFEEHLPPKCFLAHKMRIIHKSHNSYPPSPQNVKSA